MLMDCRNRSQITKLFCAKRSNLSRMLSLVTPENLLSFISPTPTRLRDMAPRLYPPLTPPYPYGRSKNLDLAIQSFLMSESSIKLWGP